MATLLLVNMIPNSLSGETEQDSEPMLAVNPNNPQQLVGTAFTPNPMGGGSTTAPVFISTDGGHTWTLNTIVPGGDMTGDITVAFGPKSNNLYAGILRQDSPPNDTELNILRTSNFQSPIPMKVLVDRIGSDQPFIQSSLGGSGSTATDRVYVGDNLPNSTVDFSLNAAAATATTGFRKTFVESRPNAGQNGPQVRTACHRSGVTRGVLRLAQTVRNFAGNTLLIRPTVVVRDDSGTSGIILPRLVGPLRMACPEGLSLRMLSSHSGEVTRRPKASGSAEPFHCGQSGRQQIVYLAFSAGPEASSCCTCGVRPIPARTGRPICSPFRLASTWVWSSMIVATPACCISS